MYLPKLDILKDHIYLLELWVIDDFEQADNIRMSYLLQDCNLSFGLALGSDSDLAQSTFLGEPLYDLDRHNVARLKTTGSLDFAKYPSTNLIDDLVLIDELAACDEVLFDLCFMSPVVRLDS